MEVGLSHRLEEESGVLIVIWKHEVVKVHVNACGDRRRRGEEGKGAGALKAVTSDGTLQQQPEM